MKSNLAIRLKPKNGKSTSEDNENTIKFIKKSLPRTSKIINTDSTSNLLEFLEKVSHIHNNLQFQCLPVAARDLCVKNFNEMKQSEMSYKTEQIYEEWLNKEKITIYDTINNFDDLSDRDLSIIMITKEVIFELLYEEQDEFKKLYPTSKFLSIFNMYGERNLDYADKLSNQDIFLSNNNTKLTHEKVTKIIKYFKEFLDTKGIVYNKLSSSEKNLIDKSRISTLESFLKFLYEENRSIRKDHNLILNIINTCESTEDVINNSSPTNIVTNSDENGLLASLKQSYFRLSARKSSNGLLPSNLLPSNLSPSGEYIIDETSNSQYSNPGSGVNSNNNSTNNSTNNSANSSPRDPNIAMNTPRRSGTPRTNMLNSAKSNYWEILECTIVANEKWTFYTQKEKKLFEEKFEYSIESLTEQEEEFRLKIRSIFFKLIYQEQLQNDAPFYSIFDRNTLLNKNYWINELDAKARLRKENPFGNYKDLKEYCDFDVITIHTGQITSTNTTNQDTTGIRTTGSIIKQYCDEILGYMNNINYDFITDPNDRQLITVQNQFCQSLSNVHFSRGLTNIIMKRINVDYKPTSPRLIVTYREPINNSFQNFCKNFKQDLTKILNKKCKSKVKDVISDDDETIMLQIETLARTFQSTAKQINSLATQLNIFLRLLKVQISAKKSTSTISSRPRAYSLSKNDLEAVDFSKILSSAPSTPLSIPSSKPKTTALLTAKSEAIPIRRRSMTIELSRNGSLIEQHSPSPSPSQSQSQASSPRINGMNPTKFEEMHKLLVASEEIFTLISEIILKDIEN